jgi:hypothetical protein
LFRWDPQGYPAPACPKLVAPVYTKLVAPVEGYLSALHILSSIILFCPNINSVDTVNRIFETHLLEMYIKNVN